MSKSKVSQRKPPSSWRTMVAANYEHAHALVLRFRKGSKGVITDFWSTDFAAEHQETESARGPTRRRVVYELEDGQYDGRELVETLWSVCWERSAEIFDETEGAVREVHYQLAMQHEGEDVESSPFGRIRLPEKWERGMSTMMADVDEPEDANDAGYLRGHSLLALRQQKADRDAIQAQQAMLVKMGDTVTQMADTVSTALAKLSDEHVRLITATADAERAGIEAAREDDIGSQVVGILGSVLEQWTPENMAGAWGERGGGSSSPSVKPKGCMLALEILQGVDDGEFGDTWTKIGETLHGATWTHPQKGPQTVDDGEHAARDLYNALAYARQADATDDGLYNAMEAALGPLVSKTMQVGAIVGPAVGMKMQALFKHFAGQG